MPKVVRIDPNHAHFRLLTPFLANRIETHAGEVQAEVNPAVFAAGVLAKLWMGDPNVLALGIVDEKGQLIGHLLAGYEELGDKRWVTIIQARADQNVGDARLNAIQDAIEWARERGAQSVLLSVHRDPHEWEKRLNFKPYRHILRLEVEPSPCL